MPFGAYAVAWGYEQHMKTWGPTPDPHHAGLILCILVIFGWTLGLCFGAWLVKRPSLN